MLAPFKLSNWNRLFLDKGICVGFDTERHIAVVFPCDAHHAPLSPCFTAILKPRINNQITAGEVRVVGEHGENLGILKLGEALALAKPETGLDLIEIAPQANPPVARLMSYDKYRYQKEKEGKKERYAQRGGTLKQVQISARAAKNDLIIKAKQLEKFLSEGHPVHIQVRLRGREKAHKEWALQKLREFLGTISIEHKVTSEPKFGGYGLSTQITKK